MDKNDRQRQAEAAAKYKTKPIIKEALQYTGENMDALRAFVPEEFRDNRIHQPLGIKTLEGIMEITEGDWIIKGVKGEFYPCKPDVFEESYELADSTPAPSEVGDEAFLEERAVEYSERHHSSLMDSNSPECRPPMNKEFRDRTYDAYKAGGMKMLAHARRTQAAEIERLKDEQSKMLCAATGGKFSKLSNIESMLGAIRQEFEDIDDEYSEKINELRALLEEASGFIRALNIVPPTKECEQMTTKWLKDLEEL